MANAVQAFRPEQLGLCGSLQHMALAASALMKHTILLTTGWLAELLHEPTVAEPCSGLQ